MVDNVENPRYKASNDRVPLNKHKLSDEAKEEIIIDFNENIKDKNYTIDLSKRGDNAHENKYNTGLSFNLMYNESGLRDLYDAGIFIDTTKNEEGKDEFTREDKLALEAKFKEIHERNGYKSDFKKMHEGDTFTYTYAEYLELAKAAGYELKDEHFKKHMEQIKIAGLDFKPTEIKLEDKIKPIDIKPIQPEGENVEVTWEKETITDENGNVTVVTDKSRIKYLDKKEGNAQAETKNEGVQVTTQSPSVEEAKTDTPLEEIDGVPQISTQGAQAQVTTNPVNEDVTVISDNSSEEEILAGLDKYLEENNIDKNMDSKQRANALRRTYNDLDKKIKTIEAELNQGGTTVTKKRFLKSDKTEIKQFTAEEKADKEAELASLQQEYDTARRYHAYVSQVQGIGATGRKNPSPNAETNEENPSFEITTVAINGERRNVVVERDNRNNPTNYYQLKVTKNKDVITGETRYEAVPDKDQPIEASTITDYSGRSEEFNQLPRYGGYKTSIDDKL